MDPVLKKLNTALKGKVQQSADMTHLTTMRISGEAQWYFRAESAEDLQNAVQTAIQSKIPYRIVGGGSNLILKKSHYPGLIIHNRFIWKKILSETSESVTLVVSSGYPVGVLVTETVSAGYSGFEYHKGLPGTVGGALYMNSKWMHPETYFGDTLIQAEVIDSQGAVKTVNRDYFHFAYDYSILQDTKEVVLSAQFLLKKADPSVLMARAQDSIVYRRRTQPTGVATSGCLFRNLTDEEAQLHKLPTKSAGYLIDKSGLKGFQMGRFMVSPVHANFIVNTGRGTPDELHKITESIKKAVFDRFGVQLVAEVEFIE